MCQGRRVPAASSESGARLIVGGGPAGMIVGPLPARAGVKVTVMEKRASAGAAAFATAPALPCRGITCRRRDRR
ncbi:FAD-dependent monooxygenase [Mycobacterium sp. IS-836]|uniref:FAD-dependent monooxygenase n=1 Tax=Mycobacterium sp. IS-836 TaxID=1834160 RepID=UPI0018E9F15F|nr:FAD-dependent monooxygenase [Mycobacterium sp. IS-836]